MYENCEGEDGSPHEQLRHLRRHSHHHHHHHHHHRERGLETQHVSSPRYRKFFLYIISNYRLLSNTPGSHTTTTTTSTTSANTMTTTSSTGGSSSCEGSMSGRKDKGRRMGLETRLVSSPWYIFFFFFFSYYNYSSLHLYLGLPLPVMLPSRNHEKGPKRRVSRRLGLK